LIDRMNKNQLEEHMPLAEAVLEGARSRLQPILLTTITTVLGMIPIAFADEFWRGIAVSLAFGLSTSTMLALVVTPAMYYAFERKKAAKAARKTTTTSLPEDPNQTALEDLPMPEPEKTIFNVTEGDPVKRVQASVDRNNGGNLPDIHSVQ